MQDINPNFKSNLPDVAGQAITNDLMGSLDWVGMSGIEVPVRFEAFEQKEAFIPAKATAFVDLHKEEARGIHMSRLFREVQAVLPKKLLNYQVMAQLLQSFLESHEGLSASALLEVNFNAPVLRKSLKSEQVAWRSYPVKLTSTQQRGKRPVHSLEVQVAYSSTCPASAALARQLIQENFKQQFVHKDLDFLEIFEWLGTQKGVLATPHAQRSYARVKIEVGENSKLFVTELIDLLEEALQTAVQALVKREDEQEFALRNGQNLMFCEDAGRRIKKVLDNNPEVIDFFAELRHVESLHPHDAVSFVSKGKLMKSF